MGEKAVDLVKFQKLCCVNEVIDWSKGGCEFFFSFSAYVFFLFVFCSWRRPRGMCDARGERRTCWIPALKRKFHHYIMYLFPDHFPHTFNALLYNKKGTELKRSRNVGCETGREGVNRHECTAAGCGPRFLSLPLCYNTVPVLCVKG